MFEFIRHQAVPANIYIARGNRHLIGKLLCSSARYHGQLLDISEVEITVDKYINQKKNPRYDLVRQYMEIYIPKIGWFRINEMPEEQIDYKTGQTTKTFTASSYETQLQDIILTTFYINAGVPLSMEMFEENLDALGVPKRNIRFYIDDPVNDPTDADYWQLGLLNILEREYLSAKGWSIGHIDTELKSLRGRKFEIDSQDMYSFLTQIACQSYKCVFVFDTIEKTVNAYQVENLGKSLNIECSRRNFLNSVNVTSQEDVLYTRYYVTGASDQATISYVNFGSSYIENLSYLMEYQVSEETAEKYADYIAYKESRREDYTETIREYLGIQQQIDAIYNQIPIDECSTSWNSYTTEDLETNLEQFQALQQALEAAHTVDGKLQIEGTADYATYLSIKDVIIPSIQAVLDARETSSAVQEIDWKINWELYGITELENKKTQYENSAQLLADKGYDKPWDSSSGTSESTHNRQYEQYQTYLEYISDINERLNVLQSKVDSLNAQINAVKTERDQIVSDIQMENSRFGFTDQELSDIQNLYFTVDFNDDSLDIQSLDDLNAVIEISKELLSSAQKDLAVRSRPQTKYSVDIENLFRYAKLESLTSNLQLGDFMFLDLDDSRLTDRLEAQSCYFLTKSGSRFLTKDGRYLTVRSTNLINGTGNVAVSYSGEYLANDSAIYVSAKIKQRLIGYSLELVDLSDTSLELEFSDMVRYNGMASDNEYLIGSGSPGSVGNGVSSSVSNYVNSAANSIALQVLQSYLNGGSSVFPNGISAEDAEKLIDILNGLIDGNLTLDELKVKLAQVDTLEANSAFIKYLNAQYLVANQADFQELTAKVATIDEAVIGKLDADYANLTFATITDLKALNATVTNLDAQFGDFVELTTNNFTAINGNIDNLNADFANIKSLLAGNAGVGDLQTIHLTSENAVIETALIKDLISQNITVNDLLAGKISTDKFEVGSDDGAILITGATQQWRDKNGTIRMQAGQDANGDFTFTLFDETGKGVLIDSTGIHEGAISDGLIVNDMVAGDANISASKLDIESLFTEINDSGEYIYSNRIWLDEKNQTLTVAFTQMGESLTVIEGVAQDAQNAADTAQSAAENAQTAADNAQSAAEAAQDSAQAALDQISNLSYAGGVAVVLSNDSFVVHTETDGTGGDFSACQTTITVYIGFIDISADATYSVSASDGVTGTWIENTRTYQVTGMTTDTGYVDFTVRYQADSAAEVVQIIKRFSISKAKDGQAGTSYSLECSASVIRKSLDDSLHPNTITVSSTRNTGGQITPYFGRYKIEESTDGEDYVTKYTSGADELNHDYSPSSANVAAIRCTLYRSGGTSELLDTQTILIITDAAELKGEVDEVKEAVQETSTRVTNIETSVDGMNVQISDMTSDIYGLTDGTVLFNVSYQDNQDGTTTLSSTVYKKGEDVTETYDASCFSWYKKSEEGRQFVGYGYSITVNNEDSGLGGATYVGCFDTDYNSDDYSYFITKDGSRLITKSDKYLIIKKGA